MAQGFESAQLDIVMNARVEGLRAMRYLRWDVLMLRREFESLTPALIQAGYQMGLLSANQATALSANLGMAAMGIAVAALALPMLYNAIKQSQERIRQEFAESEKQILATATSYEVY